VSFRFRENHRVYVYGEYVDMRSGFCRLSYFVTEKMKSNLLDGDLFLFVGKTRKLLKAICYDGTGLVLIAKRLERGRYMDLKNLDEEQITSEELDILLRGSQIRRAKFGESALTKRELPLKMPLHESP
jgi:transposase